MASLSVKDRARMFGDLASPNDTEKDRSYRRIGNKVSSSPFRSKASPKVESVNPKFSSPSFSLNASNSHGISGEKNNNIDWPDEEGIPAPDESKIIDGNVTGNDQTTTPVKISAPLSQTKIVSPFQVLNNKNIQGKLRKFDSSKPNVGNLYLQNCNVKEHQQLNTASNTVEIKGNKDSQNKIETSVLSQRKCEKDNATMDETPIESSDENKVPTDRYTKNKSTRAIRLMKAKRASPSPMISTNLKQSLQAAKVVMQEERSDAGASDASSRSSLTNKELSDIAKRALKNSKIMLKKELDDTGSKVATERLGFKASRAVAMKNSTKSKTSVNSREGIDMEKPSSTPSNDGTSRSRRMEHPAFAGKPTRPSISSDNILASFRQFNAARQYFPAKHKQNLDDSNENQKVIPENQKNCAEDRLLETHSDDDSMVSLEQEETMHSVREIPDESMHSMSGRQVRVTHGTNGRKHTDSLYRVGRVQVVPRNNCNDTVISSLSGNTQSLQSTTSQSIGGKMKSPVNKNHHQKSSFLLDPTPEYSSQTVKSELLGMISPGPSNRSTHSIANSIISASPRVENQSPPTGENANTSFLDTVEEKNSTSEESAGNSTKVLDTAHEEGEDVEIIDSPRTIPSVQSQKQNCTQSGNSCLSKDMPILSSPSPLGLVFKDTEESDVIDPPKQAENQSTLTSTAVDQNDTILNQQQGSTSTKQTVSSSIRSGISCIQNGPRVEIVKSDSAFEGADRETYEGSTSIRTGLSGLQSQKDSNDMDNSISIRSMPIEEKNIEKEEAPSQEEGNASPQYPDTIHEENETKSMQRSTISLKDENTSVSGLKIGPTATTDGSSDPSAAFSGLKVRPTTTTDGSSGTTTGASSSSDPNGADAKDTIGNTLPSIQTGEGPGEGASSSMVSPGSRSSRPWKKNFGKSIGKALKTVLAKKSPRASVQGSTRSSQSVHKENEECESLFSNDDDDIFDGLETEQEEKIAKSGTPRKQKSEGPKDSSISRRSSGSLAQRTAESFSRRANGSLSRRSQGSTSRKSNGSRSSRKTLPQKQKSTTPMTKATSPHPHDRSGIVVEESQIVHNVNSDITSSLIGGPVSGLKPNLKKRETKESLLQQKEAEPVIGSANENMASKETHEPQYLKEERGESFTLLMEESDVSSVQQKEPEPTSNEEVEPVEVKSSEESVEVKSSEESVEAKSSEETVEVKSSEELEDEYECEGTGVGSMFLNFGCGLVDPCASFLFAQRSQDDDDVGEKTTLNDNENARNKTVGLNKTVHSPKKKPTNIDKRGDDKKSEETQEKPLNTATNTVIPDKSEKTTTIDDDQCMKTTVSEGHTVSSSESGFTDGVSGNSYGNSLTSGESFGSSSLDDTRGTDGSYSYCDETDVVSDYNSRISNTKTVASNPRPILLSFSQRSLMEKFSKQLTKIGVQVLKLNTRKQWQIRYFTVSKEQIALSAHEAISKTGDTAQCPKALLWLKKFNPKNGGYGIVNIDKNGHGGMIMVDLVDIEVSDRKDDMIANPIPKKLLDGFDKSVLVTLKYKMHGILRSIEFRCRDNDEAHFLCTCMRVIRDLLRRERSLRQKLSKQVSETKKEESKN